MRTLCIITLFLSGCTSLDSKLPELGKTSVQTEQASQEKAAFDEVARLRARLDSIAHKVLAANVELCEKTAPDTGIRTQSISSFSKELRDGAARELGLGDEPVIVYVRPDSAGAKAGLKPGDQLFGDDGKPLSIPSKRFNRHVEEGLNIERARENERKSVSLDADQSCYFPTFLRMSTAINAFANGRSIIVTAGMMNFVKSDDELAYILGHELAHNTHSHVRKSITNYVLSFGGTRFTRIFESEADYVGLYYMTRAGYDPTSVEDMWRRLALQSLRPIARSKTHPAYPVRASQIAATREEIRTKQAAGEPLIPEPREAK